MGAARIQFRMGIECESPARLPCEQKLTTPQITHKLSTLRASLKSTIVPQVRMCFKDVTNDQRKRLLEDNEYWYKLSTVSGHFPRTMTAVNPIDSRMERRC